MAQFSDKSGFTPVEGEDNSEAVEILDGLLDHIAKTPEPEPSRGTVEFDDVEQVSKSPAPGHSPNFQSIEKRAAELAARLGSSRLSFSQGGKQYISEDSVSSGGIARASIHDDDLHMESHELGILSNSNPQNANVKQQEQHVTAWEADTRAEKSFVGDLDEKEREPAVVDVLGRKTGLDETGAFVLEKNRHSFQKQNQPELKDIEDQIETLSASMKSPLGVDLIEEPEISIKNEQKETMAEMQARVELLERKITDLMGTVAPLKPGIDESTLASFRDETRQAVENAILSSDLLVSLKKDMEKVGEQQRMHEQRMSDSLDALHDALKDMGERVVHVEKGVEASRAASGQKASPAKGIASSVLSTAGRDLQSTNILPESVAPSKEDDLPTWLVDTTQNLVCNAQERTAETADVFASQKKETPLEDTQSVSRKTVGKIKPQSNKQVPAESRRGANAHEVDLDAVEDVLETSNEKEPQSPSMEMQKDAKGHKDTQRASDFLRSARRAAQLQSVDETAGEPEDIPVYEETPKLKTDGNIIAAARRKQTDLEREQGAVHTARPSRNRQFRDSVEGPNSLLVFTSLILFGTSALLLYGMTKKPTVSETAVKSNAVGYNNNEKQISMKLPEVSLVKPAAKKTDTDKARDKSVVTFVITPPKSPEKSADTLTKYDKMVSDRVASAYIAPSAIQHTGALPETSTKNKSTSLFDEYVTFTRLGGGRGATAPKTHSVEKVAGKFASIVEHQKERATGLMASASRGDVMAQYEVARRYSKGIGVKKSPAISVEWYEKSAKAGYAPAIFRLATMYERGNGVAKDYKRAMQLYLSAAQKGNVKAMHNLAVLYTNGNLGKADYANALKWYKSAAEYGVKDSQFNLAIIYQNGMSGKVDLMRAYKWFSLAARAGDSEAKDIIVELREELSPKQRRKMDRELKNWTAKHKDRQANAIPQYKKASAAIGKEPTKKL